MILSQGYVDLTIGTSTRVALAPSTAAFDTYSEQAVAAVRGKVARAGYSFADDVDNAKIRELVLGQWYVKALGWRKGLELPPNVQVALVELDQIATGAMSIPGLTPVTRDAIGGSKAGALTGKFSRAALRRW